MIRKVLAGASGLALLAAGATACDLSADPSVSIFVAGATAESGECGEKKYLIPEGATLEFTAEPVEDGGSCAPIQWDDVIDIQKDSDDDGMSLKEVFKNCGGIVCLASFLTGSSTVPGRSDFNFWIDPPIISPSSGDIGAFQPLLAGVSGGGTGSFSSGGVDYQIVDVKGLKGRFDVDRDRTEISFYLLPVDPSLPADAGSVPNLPTDVAQDMIGYNPSLPGASPQRSAAKDGATLSLTFDTPNMPGAPGDPTANWDGPDTKWYGLMARVALMYDFLAAGDPRFELEVCEMMHVDDDGVSGNDDNDDADPTTPDTNMTCGNNQTVTVHFSGGVLKESKPAGTSTVGVDGHPGIARIAVYDTSPILGAEVVSTIDKPGPVPAGQPLQDGEVDVVVVDNNPWGKAENYALEAWYLTERSHWMWDDATDPAAIRHDETGHTNLGDDCFARSPSHEFRWVPLHAGSGDPAVNAEQVMFGGKPAGLKLTFQPYAVEEPVGTHFAEKTRDGDLHLAHQGDHRFKVAYRVSDLAHGTSRPTAVPVETLALGDAAQALADWGPNQPEGATAGGGTAQPVPDDVGEHQAIATSVCGGCAGFELYGVPNWEVRDTLKPSVVILAHDTKYDKWYTFGENFSADAHGNPEYEFAYAGGTGGSPETPNEPIEEYGDTGPWSGNADDATGYEKQIEGYESTFWPSNANVASNEGDYSGLWIDEDTRVEFFVAAWDNNNGWSTDGLGAGIESAEFELVDDPSRGGIGTTSISARGQAFLHLFRNPNKPDDLRGDLGEAWVRAKAWDDSGNWREVKVQIYIADNSLKIYSLEEHRSRVSND